MELEKVEASGAEYETVADWDEGPELPPEVDPPEEAGAAAETVDAVPPAYDLTTSGTVI